MVVPTILITAYKNTDQLNNLINFFPNEVNIYIHFDIKYKSLLSKVIEKQNVFTYSKYSVNWGSFNHLQSILLLCNQALKNRNNKYFHLISGEDYPCFGDYSVFQESVNTDVNYIDFFSLPWKGWAMNGGLDRINKYHLNDVYNARNKEENRIMLQFLNFQYNYNIIKRKEFQDECNLDLYGGSTWWSLTRDALEFVLKFTQENKSFFYRFRYTFCSEEIYFQTILLNNKLNISPIINNNLRYIDWTPRKSGGIPCYLDESDFLKMSSSNKIFARKLTLDNIVKYQSFLSNSRNIPKF